MVFSTNIFLFGFLPLVLGLYFLTPAKFRNLYLFVTSLLFYFWGCGPVIFVYLLCVVLNHYAGHWIYHSPPAKARKILAVILVLDLAILIYYKYFNFFSDQAAFLLGLLDVRWQPAFRVVLPIGVSFFIFRAMSYPIEIYRRLETPPKKLVDFGAWLSLFPNFIAGPIVRYSDVSRELFRRAVTVDLFFEGLARFALGLGKKVLIANNLGQVADKVFNLPAGEATAGLAWLGLLCYTFQIYYDFSGYSDMAIGLGRFFGFHFPENFNQPYRSKSITEFWRRWHMTLSRWFRDFLWFPLGANRRPGFRAYFNLFLVFLLCGFWHGAAWTFVIWGMYYGVLLVFELMLKQRFRFEFAGLWGNLYAMFLVMMGWVLFRSADLPAALDFLKLLFGLRPGAGTFLYFPMSYYLQNDVLVYLAAAFLFAWLPVERFEKLKFWQTAPGVAVTGVVSLLLIAYAAIVMSSAGFNPFIYFRF
jgi:alginate O-acetyltransferase complex protein AlgI